MVDVEKEVRNSRLGLLNEVFANYDLRDVRGILKRYVVEIDSLLDTSVDEECPRCGSFCTQFIDGGYDKGDPQGYGCERCGKVFYKKDGKVVS